MVPHDHRPSDSIQQPTGPVLPAASVAAEALLRTEPPGPAGEGDQRMHTEMGSSETEGRFRAILELAPDAIVVHDRDGCITLVNRQTVALFGYARQELLGQPVELLIAEQFHATYQQHRTDYLAAPHTRPMSANVQAFGRRRDGSEFPVEVSMSALDDAGEVLFISSMRDLSELQRVQTAWAATEAANQELRQVQALTDTALSHLALDDLVHELLSRIPAVMGVDADAILLLDEDGQQLTVRAARGLEEAVAAQAKVPLGKGVAGRIAATRAPLIVDDLSTFDVLSPYLPSRLRSVVGVPLLVEDRLVGVLHMGSATARRFTAQDVQVLQRAADRIALAIDRARLFEAEQAARREAERERVRWQAAMDSAPEFVITCDADLRRNYVNPAYERLRGGPADPSVPVEELPARHGLYLPDGTDLFPVEQLSLTRAVREGRPVHDSEMVIRNPDGEPRLVVWETAPMHSTEGELLGAVAIGRDITERKQLEREREAARTEAERQAEQFDRVFEQMADGVVVYDAHGRIARTNEAVRRLLGLDAAPPDYYQMSLPARWALYAVRDEQGRRVTREEGPLARALRGEALTEAGAWDIRMRTLDGREVELNVSAAPLRDREGHLVGAVSVYRDQTERKQMERALAESEERYRAVVETQTEMISRYLPDTTLTFVNEANCRSNGKSREELLGTKFLELLPEMAQEQVRTAIQSLLAHPGVLTVEHEVGLPDGSLRWQQWVNRTILDKDGHVVELQAVGRDITERKQMEQALQASEARYRDLVETQTELICRYLPDTTLTFVNEAYCRWYGRPREELLGRRFVDLLDESARAHHVEYIAVLLAQPHTAVDEHEVVLPDGSLGWQQWVDHPIYDAEGHLVEIQSVGRDITERKQAEQALRESEERYRAVVETQTEMITRYLPDTTLTFVNDVECRMMGKSREELLGTKWLDKLPDSAREPVQATIQSLLAHPGIRTGEHEFRLPDGSVRWQQWVNRTILDADGHVVELQGIGRDITERKRAEEALRESEARFRAAFESAVSGMVLVDTAGHPLQVNRPLAEMLGYSQEELLTHTFMDLTYPDDLEANLALFRRALAGEIESYQLEKCFIHKQGHLVWTHLSAGVVRDAAGQPLYFVGQVQDITEHKQLERDREEARAEAERQAEQLDRVFEQTADGLVVHNAQGLTVRTNAAARGLLGLETAPPDYYQLPVHQQIALYRMRDEQGRPLAPEDAPSERALRGEVLTGADAMDLQIRTLDGREVELTVSAAPLRDRQGRIVGAVRVLRDQTERKQLEREREEARANELALREVTRHMEEFLATAAHDLRSPVTGVVMGADLAQRRLQRLVEAATPPPKGDRPAGLQDDVRAALGALGHASQAAQRLSRLIVRLFDVAEARTGKLEVRLAPCDLVALMREEVAAQRLSAPDRTIHLDLPAGGAVPVVADADRIGQVLANYLANALKYSLPDRPVAVSLEVRELQARVAVRDEGPGLPPEEQARVWELFHRAPGIAVQSGWGSSLGLGLYICKTIVELHPGGQVGVESAVGRGSTFWFSLPLASEEAEEGTGVAPTS